MNATTGPSVQVSGKSRPCRERRGGRPGEVGADGREQHFGQKRIDAMGDRVSPPGHRPDHLRRIGTAADVPGRKMAGQSAPEKKQREGQICEEGAQRFAVECAPIRIRVRHPRRCGGRAGKLLSSARSFPFEYHPSSPQHRREKLGRSIARRNFIRHPLFGIHPYLASAFASAYTLPTEADPHRT